jgi:hypothetical protein
MVSGFVLLISLILKSGSDRPMNEGTTLEYFFFMSIIRDEKKKEDFKIFVENLELKIKEKKT